MDSSRRAVEAYWRSRMIDGVTSDEDKVAPVYKLEEICELLRTSHVSIVKEVSDYILKRLDHKSPVVKQKALRLIKYAVGKSGSEFRREMQRHSAAMRQLFHYKGRPDPLKGDALNKAVRETAHESISAVFASDDNKVAPTEGINKRIQGFGNTNFEMPSEDKKSFLSEVVGLGSASIKQGLSTIVAAHTMRKSDSMSYKSPNLRRSLTTEIDTRDGFEGDNRRESRASSGASQNLASASWSQDSIPRMDITSTNGDNSLSHAGDKSREERLLETIVTAGGVRLQPTRDATQLFLMEASKLDALGMSHALESKLQSHLWQVRLKAACVLESILRKKEDSHFSTIASYFSENRDCIEKCSESLQTSLREKANKVLSLLDAENTSGAKGQVGESSNTKAVPAPVVQLPDLIDTGEGDDYGTVDSIQSLIHQSNANLMPTGSLVDLFGSEPIASVGTGENKKEDDPFADVSFHTTEDRKQTDDIFSGLIIDEKRAGGLINEVTGDQNSNLLDVFGPDSDQLLQETTNKKEVHDLLAGLSINDVGRENNQSGGTYGGTFSGTALDASNQPNYPPANEALSGTFGSQMVSMNQNALFPLGSVQYNAPPNIMFNQAFASPPMNYSAMGSFITQQQLLFQNLGHLNTGMHASGNANGGNYTSSLPDVFQLSTNSLQSHGMMMSSSKKEETKAFDFISDHLSAVHDQKRLL